MANGSGYKLLGLFLIFGAAAAVILGIIWLLHGLHR
jgi:hypothetical protein